MAKHHNETCSELLAIPTATEEVLVPYELGISKHGAEAEDLQDALENLSRRILDTTGL